MTRRLTEGVLLRPRERPYPEVPEEQAECADWRERKWSYVHRW